MSQWSHAAFQSSADTSSAWFSFWFSSTIILFLSLNCLNVLYIYYRLRVWHGWSLVPVDYLFFGNLKVFFFFCVCFSVPADKHPVNISAKRFLLALCFAIAICLLFSISYSFLAIYILSSIGVTRLVTRSAFSQNNITFILNTRRLGGARKPASGCHYDSAP